MKIISISAALLAVSIAAAFIGCEQKNSSYNDVQPTETSATEVQTTTKKPKKDAADDLSSMFAEAKEWLDENFDSYETDDGVFTFHINKALGLTQYDSPDIQAAEFVFTYSDTTDKEAVISVDMGVAHYINTNNTLKEFADFLLQSFNFDDKTTDVSYFDSIENHAAIINSLDARYIIVQCGDENDYVLFIEMKNSKQQLSDKDIESLIRLVEHN